MAMQMSVREEAVIASHVEAENDKFVRYFFNIFLVYLGAVFFFFINYCFWLPHKSYLIYIM